MSAIRKQGDPAPQGAGSPFAFIFKTNSTRTNEGATGQPHPSRDPWPGGSAVRRPAHRSSPRSRWYFHIWAPWSAPPAHRPPNSSPLAKRCRPLAPENPGRRRSAEERRDSSSGEKLLRGPSRRPSTSTRPAHSRQAEPSRIPPEEHRYSLSGRPEPARHALLFRVYRGDRHEG